MQSKLLDETDGKRTFAVVQAEDELAAIGMVLGASWNGARATVSARSITGWKCWAAT